MDIQEEEFLRHIQATFIEESEEHFQTISEGLIQLEKSHKTKKSTGIIETIFRAAHSLKGAARSVDRRDVEKICQTLEDVFAALKQNEISLKPENYDLFHNTVDTIKKIVSITDTKQAPSEFVIVKKLINQLRELTKDKCENQVSQNEDSSFKPKHKNLGNTPLPDIPEKDPVVSETVRIASAKLKPLFLQAEEMIQTRIAHIQRFAELQDINDNIEKWKNDLKKWKNKKSKIDGVHYNEWQELNEHRLNDVEDKLNTLTKAFENDIRINKRLVDDHIDGMKTILMLPVASVVETFPRLVRDLARNQDKDIEIIISGKEIEVDKRILEELKNPLIHLIRNCVDHGIEKPKERKNINKPARGTIKFLFRITENHRLEIIISDDGNGIDWDKLCNTAIKAGIISEEAVSKLSISEKSSLIFQSGISTSKLITDVSGRGLGMAIVKEKIGKLGGTISVESQTKIGTTFSLIVPLILSTFRGILVEAAGHLFILPTVNVEHTKRIKKAEIKTVENRETIIIDNQVVALVSLGNVLGLDTHDIGYSPNISDNKSSETFFRILVLAFNSIRIAFHVDEILGEQEVLVKELGKQLKRVRNISGACVLGSGKVVPVLNVSDLMKSATRTEMAFIISSDEKKKSLKKHKLLVAEDSITSRTLIRNILESGGYQVVTAVDGSDAFTKVLTGEFDLLVSDVDMPRMSGFELTAKIRKDKKLGELPVVLVTALDSREDREHGMEVGANAYIIKSSFKQSNLLEAVKRLL